MGNWLLRALLAGIETAHAAHVAAMACEPRHQPHKIHPDGTGLRQITPFSTFRPRGMAWGSVP